MDWIGLRQDFQELYGFDWIGSAKMDPCRTLEQQLTAAKRGAAAAVDLPSPEADK